MALLDIHLLGSPALRAAAETAGPVDDDTRRFIDDLFETMEAARGIGLAANQVGVLRRIAVIGVDEDRFVMVDPVIVSAAGRSRAEEGCLSIPELYGEVTRPERIVLEATDRDGQRYRRELEGLVARAVQHEIDHLDGILFLDHLSLLKRQRLLARWKKEHKGESPIRRPVPENARRSE
jgi:peptide deformylase